ncbi:MAG: hypothetical protein DRH70_04240 [Candidatus Coatesbacteria bacterium]|nr:MAG: hypothetical protein DRH70_04240 [Candidatus Coatesbacteria bacterium]
MKGLEKLAIVGAVIGFIVSIVFKLVGIRLFVTATGVWRFTMVCLVFAVWVRLVLLGSTESGELPKGPDSKAM